MKIDDMANEIARKLADEGKLIEAGWAAFRHLFAPKGASHVQIDAMRLAYMAGAQHLFGSLMNILDAGEEPTDADMRKMELIAAEMSAFHAQMAAKHYPTKGNG